MGIFREIEDMPDFGRPVGDEPVDHVLKVRGDGAILPGGSLLVGDRKPHFSPGGLAAAHERQFMEGEHAVGILDHRHDAVPVSRR